MDENPKTQPTPPTTPGSLGPNARPLQSAATGSVGATINPAQTVEIESLDPTGRTMQKVVPTDESTKKKPNKGLLIGVIAGAAVLFCGVIIAVVVALTSKKTDAVALAAQRVINGEAPANLAIDGNIDISFNKEGTPIKRIKIDLDSEIITKSLINTSSATLTLTNYNNDDFSVKLNEIYAADGDLFLKVEGLPKLVEESGLVDLFTSTNDVVDCAAEETNCKDQQIVQSTDVTACSDGTQNCISETTTTSGSAGASEAIAGATKAIDEVWIKISLDEIKEISGNYVSEESPLSCFANMIGNLNKNTNTTAEIYGKYPFISSTTKDVTVSGKNGPVYLVDFDSTNFTNYINSLNSSSSSEGLFSCLGYDSNTKLDEDEVAKLFSKIPKIYAEVDDDYDFTRLYLETDIDDLGITVKVDLDFSYPVNVNASEPVEYKDFKEAFKETTTGGDTDETTE